MSNYGQLLPTGPIMAAPVGVDPQQAADMAAQSYGVMNNVMNRISNPSMIGRSPMFTAPSSSVLTPRSSGSIPMPTPAQPYQGTLPAGFDQGKAIEKMGLLGNARQQQQGYTIGDIIKLLGKLGAGAMKKSSAGQGGGGPTINPGAANPTGGFSNNPYGGGGYGGLGIGNPGSYGGINDPALTSVGNYSGVGSDWGGSRNEWGGTDHERSSRAPGVGGRAGLGGR